MSERERERERDRERMGGREMRSEEIILCLTLYRSATEEEKKFALKNQIDHMRF